MSTLTVDGVPIARSLTLRDAQFFTDENDHNPAVIPDCPHCIRGKLPYLWGNRPIAGHARCPHCHGTGTLTPAVPSPLFANDSAPIHVQRVGLGSVACPSCGRAFSTTDLRVWSGRRHVCGQKLVIDATR